MLFLKFRNSQKFFLLFSQFEFRSFEFKCWAHGDTRVLNLGFRLRLAVLILACESGFGFQSFFFIQFFVWQSSGYR